MSVSTTIKQLTIASGVYRPARWLTRRMHPAQQRMLDEDARFYRSIVSPGDLCFDIGANVGDKSEALLDIGARVVSFEPNPALIPELQARCGHRAEWRLVASAIGRTSGIATMFIRPAHRESSLIEGWLGTAVGTVDVPVLTLDQAVQKFGRPAFCKIDVEGWELEVFRGLTTRIPLIAFEFNLKEESTSKTKACLEHLALLGPAEVNVTVPEGTHFLFESWMAIRRAVDWFPGDLATKLSEAQYGDIYVRSL